MKIAVLVAFAALGLPSALWARPATCVITNDAGEKYHGPCNFTAARGGSFDVEPVGKRAMLGATSLSVYMMKPGEAEVRGLTSDGINSRWGAAVRSKTDKACWKGSDFSICVY